MASFKEHGDDCERFLGSRYPNVHIWLDEFFATFGPEHRFKRHHSEGAEEAKKFGAGADKAALIHILKDCGCIPRRRDYQDGDIDFLGMPKHFNGYWDPKAFKDAVHNLLKTKQE